MRHYNTSNSHNFQQYNQAISDLKKYCRETKTTLFPSKRYIIPRDWFDYIMNNSNYNQIYYINNSQFLNSSLKNLIENIDERKIVLIIFELMNYINKVFIIDYIIQANISFDEKNKLININSIQVFNINEFNETNVSLYKNIASINDTYLKYPHFQIIKKNDKSFSESSYNNKISLKEKEISDNETLSFPPNNKYNFSENMSFSSFNLDSYNKINLYPLGLKNPSIYCYMNCCLQILLSIPEINYFFLNKKYKLNQNHKTLICDDFSDFISLYKYFVKNNTRQMDLPPSMFDMCNTLVPKGVMNDCEEFLFLLLKSIEEELNLNNKYKNYENGNNDFNDIQKRWYLYREVNSSFIDSIFTGYIRSTVICNKCNKASFNYEPFTDLSIPIPKTDKSVKKCLNIYFEVENIDCNYHCNNCKNNTDVSM